MSTNYATALSHLILAGTGAYCWSCTRLSPFFPQGSFVIITVNSLIGIWRWGNPSYGDSTAKIYRFTSLLQDLMALPCITTTVLLAHSYPIELAYPHTYVSLIPFIAYLCDNSTVEMIDLILGVNCISLGVVSFIHQSYFGVAASISYAFTHFLVKNDNETYFDIPSQDLYNYSMCFFAIFAFKTVLTG